MNALKAFWASLPHQVQATIVVFATAAGVTVLQNAAKGTICTTWSCFTQHIGAAVSAGAAALLAFYMKPNNGAPPKQ
jgi:hypothetical protein